MAGLLRYFSNNSIGSSRSSQASKGSVTDVESDNVSTVIQTPTTKKAKRCFRAKWQSYLLQKEFLLKKECFTHYGVEYHRSTDLAP